ncbi:MAG: hypothetical protein KJO82_14475 [Gammaproteobacteria bacterium]|nr:hypothetical protein [Gammaproteobacteria bacterium]
MSQQQRSRNVRFLDKAVPLKGASHADVIHYGVDIPMRYAECFARLADGRTVRLGDKRQLLGWSGYGRNPSLLFRIGKRQIVLQTGRNRGDTFIGRDGSRVMQRRWRSKLIRHLRPETMRASRPATNYDVEPELTGSFGPAASH